MTRREVTAAIQDFTKLSTQMVDSGTQVTLEIVKKLSPEERSPLAQHVRDRVERMQRAPQEAAEGSGRRRLIA